MQEQQEKQQKGITGMTFEQLIALPPEQQKEAFEKINKVRKDAKQVNFASTYKAGAKRIAITGQMHITTADHMHKTYWQRNWAIKKIEEDAIRTTIGSKMWLFNPISGFWYSLRNEKDIFSTLNQGKHKMLCINLSNSVKLHTVDNTEPSRRNTEGVTTSRKTYTQVSGNGRLLTCGLLG